MSTAEVATLTKSYLEMQHDINGLRNSIKLTNESLQRIERALMGDEEIMHLGLIKTVTHNSKEIELITEKIRLIQEAKEIENTKNKKDKYWITGIASAIGAAFMWFINYITR